MVFCGVSSVIISTTYFLRNYRMNPDWITPEEQLPQIYAKVLTDTFEEGCLTPDGWSTKVPPTAWKYIFEPVRSESQRSISEWGQYIFGKAKDPALLVGRALNEFAELMELLLPEQTGKKFVEVCDSLRARIRTPNAVFPASRNLEGELAEEMADVMIVLLQAAEAYDIDLLGAVDAKMKVNRARKWNVTESGIGQHAAPSSLPPESDTK
jgi:NTP pyrophosphatase (non-canonical NTP hydrolase)